MSTDRQLVNFNLTREEIPPLDGHDWTREVPFVEKMANEDLRITRDGDDHWRFADKIELARLMLEKANPGCTAVTIDPGRDEKGTTALTVTVVPWREPPMPEDDEPIRYGMVDLRHEHCPEHGVENSVTFGSDTPVMDIRAALASLPEDARVYVIAADVDDDADVVTIVFANEPVPQIAPVEFSLN